ncbi:unnamed protein product, partial [Didymodactylos carnosus]
MLIPNIMKDYEIANLTRALDLRIEERHRTQDRQIENERQHLEQQKADNLHYQDLFKVYIEDVSNALFKSNNSKIYRKYYGVESDYSETPRVIFTRTNLQKVNFYGSHLCGVSFKEANLVESNFNRIAGRGIIYFDGANLTGADSRDITNLRRVNIKYINSDLRNTLFDDDALVEGIQHDRVTMENVKGSSIQGHPETKSPSSHAFSDDWFTTDGADVDLTTWNLWKHKKMIPVSTRKIRIEVANNELPDECY